MKFPHQNSSEMLCNQHYQVIQLLLNWDADPNIRDKHGRSIVLKLCCMISYAESTQRFFFFKNTIRLLLAHGAILNTPVREYIYIYFVLNLNFKG
jgi:hypothetical protein